MPGGKPLKLTIDDALASAIHSVALRENRSDANAAVTLIRNALDARRKINSELVGLIRGRDTEQAS